ncbi:hypothetical protein [Singulisphaera sp. PoT]|uniref:hypothetical protein n=1 Tax=Singulisphaera sp. PoT TaxID=3411797 RepID=UPI003BF51880
MRNEPRTIRERHTDLASTVDQMLPDPSRSSSILVQTTVQSTYPTTARGYYAVVQVDPGGAEVEGGGATLTAGTAKFYALNVGAKVPPVGTLAVAYPLNGRWVFKF